MFAIPLLRFHYKCYACDYAHAIPVAIVGVLYIAIRGGLVGVVGGALGLPFDFYIQWLKFQH